MLAGDSDYLIAELTTALQAVRNPAAYASAAEDLKPAQRAALAERAKAMTGLMLFMMEGLIRARVRATEKGICDPASVVHNAWLRWLQLHGRQAHFVVPMDGWLVSAFPTELLCRDTLMFEVLAAARRLGEASRRQSDAIVPAEFFVPVAVCFREDRALTAQLMSQLVALLKARIAEHNKVHGQASLGADVTDCIRRLAVDLVSPAIGPRSPSPLVEYPGH